MEPGSETPAEYVEDPKRAEEQAYAEKPGRDLAADARRLAKESTLEDEQQALLTEAALLDASAGESGKEVAFRQAIAPTEQGEFVVSKEAPAALEEALKGI